MTVVFGNIDYYCADIMNVFIIHGSFGDPQGNWFPWLSDTLEQAGHEVIVPEFPVENYDTFKKQVDADPDIEPTNQNVENWFETFQPYMSQVTTDTVFVGHSLGPAFILRILEQISIKVQACIFAAGFIDVLPGFPEFNAVNSSFIEPAFDWDTIKGNCSKFYCLGSDDDPYVPLISLKKLAQQLDTTLEVIQGGGHLSKGSVGMTEFPRVFGIIQSL